MHSGVKQDMGNEAQQNIVGYGYQKVGYGMLILHVVLVSGLE